MSKVGLSVSARWVRQWQGIFKTAVTRFREHEAGSRNVEICGGRPFATV